VEARERPAQFFGACAFRSRSRSGRPFALTEQPFALTRFGACSRSGRPFALTE
jgi:hypothetical protein